MRRYNWPGNVRELRNAVERAVVMGRADELLPTDLRLSATELNGQNGPAMCSLKEAESRHIDYVLHQVHGNKTKACRILGIGRGTLYKKLEPDSEP